MSSDGSFLTNYADIIASEMLKIIKKENELLICIGNNTSSPLGIFHMPELALAYECGKQIIQQASTLFGDNIPKWSREINLGNGGPTDLLFTFQDKYKIIIEFKMRDTEEAYIGDLTKLSKLGKKDTIKLFCAIIDVFEKDLHNDGDGRVLAINHHKLIKRKLYLESFKTKQSWYKSNVVALYGVWEVN